VRDGIRVWRGARYGKGNDLDGTQTGVASLANNTRIKT
jgi:hypothetical protein